MASVYSILCYEHAGTTVSPVGPPSGSRWVVRDISVTLPPGSALTEFALDTSSGGVIAFHEFPGGAPGDYWQWEGRQVVDYPTTIFHISTPGPVSVRVSGYQLSLP